MIISYLVNNVLKYTFDRTADIVHAAKREMVKLIGIEDNQILCISHIQELASKKMKDYYL